MELKINPKFADRKVTHSNTSKMVKDHSKLELRALALIAAQSQNPILVEIFTDLPSAEDILAADTRSVIARVLPATPNEATKS